MFSCPLGAAAIPAADARHVDRRVRVARQAHHRHRPQTFAIVGPAGRATCPMASRDPRPTNFGWIIGRTQVDGTADYRAVHNSRTACRRCRSAITASPTRRRDGDRGLDMRSRDQVAKMDDRDVLSLFAEADAQTRRTARLSDAGAACSASASSPASLSTRGSPPEVKAALDAAPRRRRAASTRRSSGAAGQRLARAPEPHRHLRHRLCRAGRRSPASGSATTARGCVLSLIADARREARRAAATVRFAKDQLPPVRAFWSLTMYDDRQLFAANPRRFALGDRDKFSLHPDGSLDLYVQRERPGPARSRTGCRRRRRPLHPDTAPLLAEARRDRRHVGAAARDGGALTAPLLRAP